MKTCKRTHLIGAIALLAVGCDRAPEDSGRSDSSLIVVTAIPTLAAAGMKGSFAYVDSSGTLLLALDSVPDPSTILGAVCWGGVALPVRYDRRQARQAGDNGRQLAYNFRNQQGDVFRVTQERAPPDKTCYLSRDSTLLANASLAAMREPSDCSPAHASRLAAGKRRQVTHCWRIASTPTNLDVLAVQFATIDSNALASLAVVGDTSLWFQDFPAIYNDESTWRVDDGGVFSPTAFDILFVAALPYGFVMAIAWAGAEGESCELLLADSAGAFRKVTTGYRYWAPS